MVELDKLVKQVTAVRDVSQSAVTLINGIALRIEKAVAAATSLNTADRAAILKLSDDLKQSSDDLANAVSANTVAEEATTTTTTTESPIP